VVQHISMAVKWWEFWSMALQLRRQFKWKGVKPEECNFCSLCNEKLKSHILYSVCICLHGWTYRCIWVFQCLPYWWRDNHCGNLLCWSLAECSAPMDHQFSSPIPLICFVVYSVYHTVYTSPTHWIKTHITASLCMN